MRRLLLALFLSLATNLHAATESVSIDTATKQVKNPIVHFGGGNTLNVTGATLIGFPSGSGITLQTNDVLNSSQTLLNLKQGGGIVLTDNGGGQIIINSTGGVPVGGLTGFVLTKNSNLNYDMSWQPSSGTPAGSNKQFQYNNLGAFGGVSGFEYDTGTSRITVTPQINAPVTLHSAGDTNNVATLPYTAANSGIFVKDVNNVEVLRIWASDPDPAFLNYNAWNLYVGKEAGFSNPSDNVSAGYGNTGIGYQALYSESTGYANTAVGVQALQLNTTGRGNTAVGYTSLQNNTTGVENVAIGLASLGLLTTGLKNTALGYNAGAAEVDTLANVSVGYHAGSTGGTTDSIHDDHMVYLGAEASKNSASTLTNGIALGAAAQVTTSNTAVIGNSSVTDAYFGSVSGNAILHGKGVLPSGGTTGQSLTKNSNTNFDVGWSTISGGGTPGGSNTQVQFNDSGAFGGDTDFTWNKTTNVLNLASGSLLSWNADTGITRNAAGIVEINNGTAGQYRDLFVRQTTSDFSSSDTLYNRLKSNSGSDGFLHNPDGFTILANNTHYQASPGWTYDKNGAASAVVLTAGLVSYNMAPSGTAGGTPAFKSVTFDSNGTMSLPLETSAPGSPAEGWLYANSTSHTLNYYNGTSFVNLTGGGTIGGSIANTQVAYGSGTNTITGDTNLTVPSTGILNAQTGFRIAGAATNGNVLMGNGTNFVSLPPTGTVTGHGNADISIAATEGVAYTNAAFTGAHTWTLPAANAVPAGKTIRVIDLQNTVTFNSNVLIVSRTGTDNIMPGTLNTVQLMSPGDGVELQSDGVSKWMVTDWMPGTNTTSGTVLTYSAGTNKSWTRSRMAINPLLNGAGTNGQWLYQLSSTAIDLSTATLPVTAGTSGTILQSNASGFVNSTPTWPTSAGTAGYQVTSDGTNLISKAADLTNGSSTQQTGFAANTYLAGSGVTITAGDVSVGSQYHCVFDMAKTTAGTATPIITIHMGTAGTTSDAAVQTITFAGATGVADTGMFEVWVNFRAVGASATVSSVGKCVHNLAATGLTATGAAGVGVVSNTTSSTFNSTAVTKIGIGFNGGASYVGTNNIVQATFNKL